MSGQKTSQVVIVHDSAAFFTKQIECSVSKVVLFLYQSIEMMKIIIPKNSLDNCEDNFV